MGMDLANTVQSEPLLSKEAEEQEAYRRIQLLITRGDRNARESLFRLDGMRRRLASRAETPDARSSHLGGYSDILLRVQVRELAELARMGITPAVSVVAKIRSLKSTASDEDIKQTVSKLHETLFQKLTQCLNTP